MRNFRWLYLALLLVIAGAVYYLDTKVAQTQQTIAANIKRLFVEEAAIFSKNIRRYLFATIDPRSPVERLEKDPMLRANLEHALSLLVTPTYQYIYILYRDPAGKYRYLVDGSRSEEKGTFREWIHVDAERWDRVYFGGTPQVIAQKKYDTLWGTYLYPLKESGRTVAMIAIDFSTRLPAEIKEAAQPVNTILFYIIAAIGLFILLLLVQGFLLHWVRKKSYIDPLTGAYNRLFLRRFLESHHLDRYKILMMDLDHFKKINDEYGHKTGDAVLQEFSDRVRRYIREGDLFVRYGGEEFLVFIRKASAQTAREIAERIRSVVGREPFQCDNLLLHVTTSIGLVERPAHYRTPALALKAADELLYTAKRLGRDRVVSSSDPQANEEASGSFLGLETIRRALEEERLVCHFQPIYDLRENRIVKFETLVRIVGQDGTLHYPGSFLPVIAHTTLYNDMTKRVLEHLFRRLESGGCAYSVNLNLSDLLDDKIFHTILTTLERNAPIADRLVVELLEHETVTDLQELKRRVETIKAHGVRIALDDFGSGYANFSLFQNIAIDILKIDGSLIRHLTTSERSHKIVQSIYEFADRLDIEVVAEYIHDEATLRKVLEIGIPFGQGFHLSRPLSQEELPSLRDCR